MAPEDVPDDLARTAVEGYYGHAVPDGGFAVLRGEWQRALAAVLPAHEAMVRAKVASDIQAERVLTNREITALVKIGPEDPDHVDCGEVYLSYAARIARGELAPAQTTAAHTPGTAAERTDG